MSLKKFLVGIVLVTGLSGGISAQLLSHAALQQSLQALAASKFDTARIELLLQLSKHYIFKPGEIKTDLDSAILLIEQAATLSKKLSYNKAIARSYHQCSMAYREKGDRIKGKEFALKAISATEQSNEYLLLGESFLELSQYYAYWNNDELPEKIKITQKAYDAFLLSGNKERQAFTLKNLGDLHQLRSVNLPVAIGELREALKLYQQIHYAELHGVYDLLGFCFMRIGDYSAALKYGLLAEQTAQGVNDTTMQLCTIYIRIGLTYFRLGDYTPSESYFMKALAVAEKYKDIPAIHECASNVVNCMVSGRPREALVFFLHTISRYPASPDLQANVDMMLMRSYSAARQFKEAQHYYDIVLRNYDKKSPEDFHVFNAIYGSTFLIRSGQYAKAATLIDNLEKLPLSRVNIVYRREIAWQHYLMDSTRGDFKAALNAYRNYKKLSDSIFNANQVKQVAVTKIEFETEKKEQSINFLTRQNQLQTKEIKQSQIIRNGTIAGSLVLLFLLSVLYYQNRQKNKKNRLLQRQKEVIDEKSNNLQRLVDEKEWLLKEVHHRVKNNLQTVVSLLESQSAYLQNDALLAIQDSQNRIYAMSLIHQKLYQAENVAAIKMNDYLPELVNYLKDSFDVNRKIRFDVQVSALELDVSQAVPVGLILNEAITNAIKYAFPIGSNNATITIRMEKKYNDVIDLTVSDNGKGLPEGFDWQTQSGLGLKLMKGLTEDIEGQFSIRSAAGTNISICFMANTPLHKGTTSALSETLTQQA